MLGPILFALLALCGALQGESPPSEAECKELIAEYMELGAAPEDDARRAEILARVATVEPLKASKARTWGKRVVDAAKRGEKLEADHGLHQLEDGRYYYVGGDTSRPKGIVLHLHGGRNVPPLKPFDPGYAYFLAASRHDWVVVMPRRIDGEWWWHAESDRAVRDVLAAARRTWRVDDEHVYLSGVSAGARGGWRLASRYAERFAGYAAFSGGAMAALGEEGALEDGLIPNLRDVPVVFYHAVDDMVGPVASSRGTRAKLEAAAARWGGFLHRYDEVMGTKHGAPDEGSDAQYEWLAEHGTRAVPDRVVWQPADEGDRIHHWLAWEAPRVGAVVTADLDREANAVHLTLERDPGGGLSGLEVLLRDDLLDLKRAEVVVTVGGEEVFRGAPERRLDVILRTGARGEEGLLFDASVRL